MCDLQPLCYGLDFSVLSYFAFGRRETSSPLGSWGEVSIELVLEVKDAEITNKWEFLGKEN